MMVAPIFNLEVGRVISPALIQPESFMIRPFTA